MNKYENWYNSIIDKARARVLTNTYTETHHVIPRSLGGLDTDENLVKLTAREHFICHWLLTKTTTGAARNKMINALVMMQGESTYQERYKTKITSRVFANLREEYARHISERNTGRIQPLAENAKQKAAMTGRKRAPFSDEWLAKLKAARQGERNGMYGKQHSNETREKQSKKAIGRKQSNETIQKKANAIRGSKREKKHCPHCDQMIAVNTFVRWHGDNCKLK